MFLKRASAPLGEVDFENAADKRAYNRRLFETVAPAYGRVTAVLSFGQDRRWKERLVSWLHEIRRPVCLDLACGTGDFLGLLRGRYPDGRVVGIDLSAEMMAAGAGIRDGRETAFLTRAGMESLPLKDASVDIVTGGYAIRNAPDLDTSLDEVARVLKPGGSAAFLDFSKPPSPGLAAIELSLLGFWGRIWGRAFHGDGDVYGYLARSLAHFPDREQLTDRLAARGLDTVRTARPFFGFLELRLVEKPPVHRVHGAEGDGQHGEVRGDKTFQGASEREEDERISDE